MKNWHEELVIKFAKDVAALSLSPFQVEDFIPVFLEHNGLGEIQYEAPKGNLNEPVEDFEPTFIDRCTCGAWDTTDCECGGLY